MILFVLVEMFMGELSHCISEDIPIKLLLTQPLPPGCFFVELYLRKQKWLISFSYNRHKINISKQTEMVSKNLDLYSSRYKSNIFERRFLCRSK